MVGRGEHYALMVDGDSMVDAGIQDGDTVVIERCEVAENGTIVVALIDNNEVTLKRLRRKGDSIALGTGQPGAQDAHLRPRPGAHPGQAGRTDAALLSVARRIVQSVVADVEPGAHGPWPFADQRM